MIPALCAATLLATAVGRPQDSDVKWFGPATAVFRLQFNGNPYDPAENDVHVHFIGPGKLVEDRLAYYDPKLGAWCATLASEHRGSFKPELYRNGELQEPGPSVKLDHPLPHGFIRVDPRNLNRFRWDDGTPYVGIGFDLGWQNGNFLPMTDEISKMGKAGANWTRIWACSWDGKNPWWPSVKSTNLEGKLWEPAIDRWDEIVRSCETSGVDFQFVLFHHGEFSSTTDSNWGDNPWNFKNGGFLKDAGDFFTNPEAKRLAKLWLRYAVARFGSSPSVMAWELFNEVQWVDAVHENRWADIEAWHKEMADYVRSIDSYHHLVTTSSELRPGLTAAMDYIQLHTYPADIFASILGTQMPADKPGFYGEFGPSSFGPGVAHKAARDGALAGLLANHAASGMFWYWDRVETDNLYSEYTTARKVADLSDWAHHPNARLASLSVSTEGRSPFVFTPGLGWAPSTQNVFELPLGGSPEARAKLSEYVQGKSNAAMSPGPLTLNFEVPTASKMRLAISGASKSGAGLNVVLDGTTVKSLDFPAGTRDSGAQPPVDIDIPTGRHTVVLANPGSDWFRLGSVTIDNLAPQAAATALAESDWMMLRLTAADTASLPLTVNLGAVPLADAQYDLTTIDLDTGQSQKSTVSIKSFRLAPQMASRDEILIFKRR